MWGADRILTAGEPDVLEEAGEAHLGRDLQVTRVVVATPVAAEEPVLPRGDGRQLADDVATRTQEVARPLEHGARIDHVLEDVVHGDDVISSDMLGQVGGLEGPLENVVAPGPSLGRDVRLDLDARTLQIEEATELVEVPAVAGADVEDAARADSGSAGRRSGPAIGP